MRLGYKHITEQNIEELSDQKALAEIADKCRVLLPIFERLSDPIAKCKLFTALAKCKLKIFSLELKASKIDKKKYLMAVKPYVALQIQAGALNKKFCA